MPDQSNSVQPPPGFRLVDPAGQGRAQAPSVTPPPGFTLQTPPNGQQATPDAQDGFFSRVWNNLLQHGNLLGRENALEQSAAINDRISASMKAGKPIGKSIVEGGGLENPMVSAFGVGNIGPRVPMRAPNPEATARLRDFTEQGVTPNVPTVGQGRASGLVAQANRILPFSPVQRGIRENLTETAGAAERAAGQYGEAADAHAAGSVARNAGRRFAEDRSAADRDYGEFYRLMHGANRVQLPHTLGVVRDIMGRYDDQPELTGLFTNPKLVRLSEALEPKKVTIPGKTSPVLDASGRPTVTTPAKTVERGGELGMRDLREVRTQIGYELENPTFGPESIPRAQLRRIYGGLTRDMQEAARWRGPAAVKALNRATTAYGTRMRMLDRIEPLLKPDAPEAVFARLEAAAKSSGHADAGLLRAAQRTMAPEEWNNIGAAVIRRMGDPTPGAPRPAGVPEFSINTYATNWNRLSGRAKDLLFGVDVPSSPRSGLEQLARVVNAQKNVASLANTSHTAEVGAVLALVGDVFGSLTSGRVPIPELAGVTGAYGVSKLMMSPAFTRWLYQAPNLAAQPGGRDLALNALGAALRSETGQEAGREVDQPGGPGRSPRRTAPAAPAPAYPWQPATQ